MQNASNLALEVANDFRMCERHLFNLTSVVAIQLLNEMSSSVYNIEEENSTTETANEPDL